MPKIVKTQTNLKTKEKSNWCHRKRCITFSWNV